MLARSRLARLLLAAGVAATGVFAEPIAANATAASRKPFAVRIEPWIPGSPPSTPPAVDLTAACIRRVGRGEREVVFGYDNPGEQSVYAPLEAQGGVTNGNLIVRTTHRGRGPRVTTVIESSGPQATLFLPGQHPHVFAVRFKSNETIAWQVRIPSSDDPVDDPGWKVTVKPRRLPSCGRAVPDHFTVVQTANAFLGPTNI